MGQVTYKDIEAKSKMKHPSDMPTLRFELRWLWSVLQRATRLQRCMGHAPHQKKNNVIFTYIIFKELHNVHTFYNSFIPLNHKNPVPETFWKNIWTPIGIHYIKDIINCYSLWWQKEDNSFMVVCVQFSDQIIS